MPVVVHPAFAGVALVEEVVRTSWGHCVVLTLCSTLCGFVVQLSTFPILKSREMSFKVSESCIHIFLVFQYQQRTKTINKVLPHTFSFLLAWATSCALVGKLHFIMRSILPLFP